ncbi:glycoside hydrolase family 125 protein [Desemzia sp. RIT804]|uniref:glycoside hydrolase family 125 protein n=1 Tax=Desemzia sp. RIT 804 TaxID=2810209 RepID=UPI0019521397|nr:glycoside hydrolase family 125 protein [Desemzia sp. RIT 804]
MEKTLPQSIQVFMNHINSLGKEHPEWLEIFNGSFLDTLQNTVKILEDDTTFVLTGDIPAMWLRDSTAQIRPYLFLANESEEIKSTIKGLIERHFKLIHIDPYANAFNEEENNAGHQTDHTKMKSIVWERKYEIDSLCYPIQLSYLYYKQTKDTSHFNDTFLKAIEDILTVWETEQRHKNSPYLFERDTWRKEDTLVNEGKGSAVAYTGMTWSGFRPSDDTCEYHYLVPSNMFAVVVLHYLEEIFTDILPDEEKKERVKTLREEIKAGIRNHAIVENKQGKKVYAYEVDGLGNASIMDDANVPNLLSAPYLGFCTADDPVYVNTRETILSPENPYYYSGSEASGIGSSHTPEDYIWHLSLAMEGLTSDNKEDKKRVLDTMVKTDGGKNAMHEGFHKDDSTQYTREWFSWPNMLFCELMLDYFGYTIER